MLRSSSQEDLAKRPGRWGSLQAHKVSKVTAMSRLLNTRHAKYSKAFESVFAYHTQNHETAVDTMTAMELGHMFTSVSFNMSQFQLKNLHSEVIDGSILTATEVFDEAQLEQDRSLERAEAAGDDGEKFLTQAHFTHICLCYINGAMESDSLDEAYKVLDPDLDGSLSVVEIRTLMVGFGSDVTANETDAMMLFANKHGFIHESWRVYEKEFQRTVTELPYIPSAGFSEEHKKIQERWLEFKTYVVLVHVLREWWHYTKIAYGEEWQEQWGLDQRKRCCFYHPNSPGRTAWDLAMLPIFLQILIFVPYRVGFDIDVPPGSADFWVDVGVDLYFMIDLVINFRTAFYVNNGKLVTENKRIVTNYLMSWFAIDFVSCLPVTYIVLLIHHMNQQDQPQEDGAASQIKMMKILRLMRLVKNLAKLSRLKKLKEIKVKYEDQLARTCPARPAAVSRFPPASLPACYIFLPLLSPSYCLPARLC